MFGKTTLIVGAAAGYVLGTRAGRERYDQIVDQANKLWRNPKVQETVSEAQDAAKQQASAVKDKAKDKAAKSSNDFTSSSPSDSSGNATPKASVSSPTAAADLSTPAAAKPGTNGTPGTTPHG